MFEDESNEVKECYNSEHRPEYGHIGTHKVVLAVANLIIVGEDSEEESKGSLVGNKEEEHSWEVKIVCRTCSNISRVCPHLHTHMFLL